jgi:hypothetical protein
MTAIQMAEEYGVDKVRMCGTVHDSIIFLVKRKYVVEVHDRILEIMRRPKLFTKLGIKMKVPIEGEVKIGAWSKGVTLERWQHQQRLKQSTASSRVTAKRSSISPSYALAA